VEQYSTVHILVDADILLDSRRLPSFEFRKNLTKEHSFRITIPKEIIDELGWNVNDVILIGVEGDKIIIRKEKERSRSPSIMKKRKPHILKK
jgi:AbrB family looped-hinge helix DNA binding protein